MKYAILFASLSFALFGSLTGRGGVLSVNVSVCSIALDEVASWTYILAHEH